MSLHDEKSSPERTTQFTYDEYQYEVLCQQGSLEQVKDFLSDLSGKRQEYFNAYVSKGLWILLDSQKFAAIRFILESPLLASPPAEHVNKFLSGYLNHCCSHGNLTELRYLLERCPLKSLVDLGSNDYTSFKLGYMCNHSEMVSYLLGTGKVPLEQIEECFLHCVKNGRQGIVQDLLLKNHIELTAGLKQKLVQEHMPQVWTMFELRELNEKLHQHIASQTEPAKRVKI